MPAKSNFKKLFILLLVSLFFVSQINFACAGAYEWEGLGARAQAMGGAFIGLADDWTAIFWNPAGLAQLKDKGWGIDFYSPHPVVKDGNSLSNFNPDPNLNLMDTRYQIDTFADYSEYLHQGDEPDRFNKTKLTMHFYSLNGLGTYWKYRGFTLGAGFYIPVGNYLDWQDNISYGSGAIHAKLFQQFFLSMLNFSIAKEINSKFSLGLGINYVYGKIDYLASKTVAASGIFDYTWNYEAHSKGGGIEGVFGGLFKITDKLKLGGVYRTGSVVTLRGEASTKNTATGIDEASDFKQKFPHPATWGVGLAYKPKPNLTLTADLQRTLWSTFRTEVYYDRQGLAIYDKYYSADWHDSSRYRLGVEYKPVNNWALRAGYFFDQSPLPDKSLGFSDIADVDRHTITLGLGHETKNRWGLDILYLCAWGERKANGVSYSQSINSIGITVSHKF